MQHIAEVGVPGRMQKLRRDRRGLPVPFIVMEDMDGRPHFTINDTRKVRVALADARCSICGARLLDNMWAIGGPLSFAHEHGAFLDPFVHKDCGTYALKVCPYIALSSWNDAKRIDAKTVDPSRLPGAVLFEDRTMIPERPAFFMFGKTSGYWVTQPNPGHFYVHARRPYKRVEFWKDGRQIDRGAAAGLFVAREGYPPDTLAYWPDAKVAA